jgi:C4-dicarboxylate-specific signal transduction histidine kinase
VKRRRTYTFWRTAAECLLASVILAALTFVAFRLHSTTTMAALLFFFFIVLVSLWAGFVTSVFACILAVLCFNYFFAPPIFDLRVRDPRDIAIVVAFSSTGLVISRLMSRIRQRTAKLEQANEHLRTEIVERKRGEEAYNKAQAELAHVSRITTMGELVASIAHEINQPLAAIVINGNTCMRWLAGDSPNIEEAREAACRIALDGVRAGDVIARIRALATKTTTAKGRLDINEVVQEVVALAGGEVHKNGVTLRTDLADDLSPVFGDRVQLQQVVLNLVMNGVEAMSTVGEHLRELVITTQEGDADHVRVVVKDSGIGLDPESMERIFDAFYSTKNGGMGMGLSISRSIVQNHGGRLWAVANDGPGMTFQFTVPKYQESLPAGA